MTAHPYVDTLSEAQEVIQQLSRQLEPHGGGDTGIIVSRAEFDAMVNAVEALAKMIREQYLRDYAETLLVEHAQVEFLTISEAAEEFLMGGSEITEDEMRFVHNLIGRADVSVRLPPLPEGVDR